jgi:hypothetical protein
MNPLWPEPGPNATCEGCVWRYSGGRGSAVDRCRRHADARVDAAWPACPAHTSSLDCQACGACCREAYHAVEVSRRDAFVRTHPDRIVRADGRLQIARAGDRCACLAGSAGAYTCVVYADRPRTCREFEQAGRNCVEARRRVRLTP